LGIGAHHGQISGYRIYRNVHANVHQAGDVTHRQCRRVEDSDIMIEQVPPFGPAGKNGIGPRDVFGPVPIVVVEPSTGLVLFHDQPDAWWRGICGQ